MKQVVAQHHHSNPNDESMGIWKECYCRNNNNDIGGGMVGGTRMDADEDDECFDDLTNTLESSRYHVLRNKALFQF